MRMMMKLPCACRNCGDEIKCLLTSLPKVRWETFLATLHFFLEKLFVCFFIGRFSERRSIIYCNKGRMKSFRIKLAFINMSNGEVMHLNNASHNSVLVTPQFHDWIDAVHIIRNSDSKILSNAIGRGTVCMDLWNIYHNRVFGLRRDLLKNCPDWDAFGEECKFLFS